MNRIMKNPIGLRSIFAASVMGLLILVRCSGQDSERAQESIRLGVVLSLSGEKATYGIDCLNGIRMAIDLANIMGGVKGKKVELVVVDDSSSTIKTMSAVQQLASDASVLGIIGGTSSKLALSDAGPAQELGIPFLSPLATNPNVTDIGSYVSRICFIDPYQGAAMAEYSFKYLKIKTVGIILDPDDEYSLGLGAYFMKSYRKMGGEIVFEHFMSNSRLDSAAVIAETRKKQPNAIFMPCYHVAAAELVGITKNHGLNIVLLGGDGWESAEFNRATADLLTEDDDIYLTTHFSPDNTEPLVYRFVTDYASRFGEKPTAPSALGYDAGGVICEALRRTPRLSRQSLAESINSIVGFQGVTGTISINEKRNPAKSVVVLKAYGGKFFFEATVNP
jgi:branched-chain amino acid transport system substrate-binding protein